MQNELKEATTEKLPGISLAMKFEGKQPVSVDHPINYRFIVSEKKINFLVLNFFGISCILPTLKRAGRKKKML